MENFMDERVKALVLFAPAVAWFKHPDLFIISCTIPRKHTE